MGLSRPIGGTANECKVKKLLHNFEWTGRTNFCFISMSELNSCKVFRADSTNYEGRA
jgi:hypothetical protein